MTRLVRLSPEASARLDAVLDWTFDRFGPRQAERYRAQFDAAFVRLADTATAGRSVREHLAPRAAAELRFVKAGSHLILFRERDGEVEIIDVLHEAMDVAGRARESDDP